MVTILRSYEVSLNKSAFLKTLLLHQHFYSTGISRFFFNKLFKIKLILKCVKDKINRINNVVVVNMLSHFLFSTFYFVYFTT